MIEHAGPSPWIGLVLLAATFVGLSAIPAFCAERRANAPIAAQLVRDNGFATFTNRLHPGNRIGYRFHEHTPLPHGPVPASTKAADIDEAATAKLVRGFAARPGVVTNSFRVAEKGWAPQQWTFYLAPVADGVDLLLVVEAFDVGLNDFYGVQQCFRMSGKTNSAWRRKIAETPAFSEFDLWRGPEKGAPDKTSLAYVLRKGRWAALPACKESVGARTPLGVRIDRSRTGGDLTAMPKVGPYEARMTGPIDCGLVTRIDRAGTWVCGIYWERTSHVTDHHPADCLHAIVNIGPIPPHAKRAVRGKIYWFKGTLNDLTARWRQEKWQR